MRVRVGGECPAEWCGSSRYSQSGERLLNDPGEKGKEVGAEESPQRATHLVPGAGAPG